MKKTCYISGPMSGIEHFNYPAFFDAEKILKKFCKVVNPARISEQIEAEKANPTYSDYFKADVLQLMNCDCLFLLKGWESSRGATLEKRLAEALEIPCFTTILEVETFLGK